MVAASNAWYHAACPDPNFSYPTVCDRTHNLHAQTVADPHH